MISLERSTGSRRIGWVSLVGALLVPIMVAAGFLAATWNSTSRWDKVQAAIVNADQPVKVGGQTVPLGRQLASGLVKGGTSDHQKTAENFTWVISDADDAADGLADGRYAAVVTIPKDFSKDATSYAANKGSKAEQATLDVQTSTVSGVTDSAIASAISSAAVGSLNGELTKQYLDNLYLGFNQTQQGIQKSADGAKSLATGVSQLDDGIGKSATGADTFATGMKQLSTGTGKLSDGLGQTDTGISQLATGVSGLADGIKQTDTGVGKLDTGAGKLADGTDDYTKGARSYAKGVRKYTDGVSKLTGGIGSYADGVDQYAKGSAEFAGSIRPAIATARKAVSAQSSTNQACTAAGFTPGSTECSIFAAGMKAGASGVADGLQQGLVGTKSAPGPALKLQAGAGPLESASTKLSGSAGKLGKAGDQIATGATGLATGAKTLDRGVGGLAKGIDKLATGTGKLSQGAGKLSTGATRLSTGFSKLTDAGKQLATGASQSATGAGKLSDGLSKLHDGSGKLATGSSQLATGLKKAADQIPTYSDTDRTQLADVVSAPVAGDQPSGLFANATTTTLLLALALWVGGLATYLVVRAISSEAFGSQKSSARLALEGVAPGVIIGAAQAVILSVIMAMLLDLSAGRTAGLLGFSLFAAVTFAVLNQALVAWLGGIGRFVSTAVVVMAVAGSLTNAIPDAFARGLSYLPITPALQGVRAIVTGNSSPGHQVAVLLAWLVIGGVASVLAVARRRVAASSVPVPVE